MSREEFDRLVHQVEARYAGKPRRLRLRIALLALVGYTYFAAWLGLVLITSTVLIVPAIRMGMEDGLVLLIFGAIILVFGLMGVARVLWVRVPAPEGRLISRSEAPKLFAALDELRRALRSSRFHRVLVISACNASVTESPLLGVFGWPRNYLQMGLPVLDALSPEELHAVLAHEAAHLSARHGRFSGWIYRLRRSWEAVYIQLTKPAVRGTLTLRPLLLKFFSWFWPRFNAHAFVLSRSNEFEADAVAAQQSSRESTAMALRRLALCSRFLEENFWPDLWQRAAREATPPDGVFQELSKALERGGLAEETARWSAEALRLTTDTSDTHPCLVERLNALRADIPNGEPLVNTLPAAPCAGDTFFGEAFPAIRADVEKEWRRKCTGIWRERHDRALAINDRLDSLSRVTTTSASTPEALWDRTRATMELEGDAAAESLLRELLAIRPDHVLANFQLGRVLLDKGDAAGEALLERAMAEDEEMVPHACGLLHVHFQRTGNAERLAALRARLDRHEAALNASRNERINVTASDRFLPHGLTDEELAPLRALLSAEPDAVTAELAQKELKHFVNQRLYVLCVRAVRPWHGFADESRERALVQRLIPKVKLPGRVLVIAPVGSFRPLAKKIARVSGATVYPRAVLGQLSTFNSQFSTAK